MCPFVKQTFSLFLRREGYDKPTSLHQTISVFCAQKGTSHTASGPRYIVKKNEHVRPHSQSSTGQTCLIATKSCGKVMAWAMLVEQVARDVELSVASFVLRRFIAAVSANIGVNLAARVSLGHPRQSNGSEEQVCV